MPGGRPTKYTPELIEKAWDYYENYEHYGDMIPSVVGMAVAGKKFNGEVHENTCIRIMTGAQMPEACDTVIPQEFVTVENLSDIETISFSS